MILVICLRRGVRCFFSFIVMGSFIDHTTCIVARLSQVVGSTTCYGLAQRGPVSSTVSPFSLVETSVDGSTAILPVSFTAYFSEEDVSFDYWKRQPEGALSESGPKKTFQVRE